MSRKSAQAQGWDVKVEWSIFLEDSMEKDQECYPDVHMLGFLFAQNVDYMMNILSEYLELFDGDATTMLIFFTMARTSVDHLNRRNEPRAEAKDGVFPDDLRRPVAVLSIANYLGLPYETTRRHVMKLVTRGFCQRMGSREFLISSETLSRPEFAHLARQSFALTKTYLETIRPYIAP